MPVALPSRCARSLASPASSWASWKRGVSLRRRRIQKTDSAGMAPKASSRRHTRFSDIPDESRMMASTRPTIRPRPCMENPKDTIRPPFF